MGISFEKVRNHEVCVLFVFSIISTAQKWNGGTPIFTKRIIIIGSAFKLIIKKYIIKSVIISWIKKYLNLISFFICEKIMIVVSVLNIKLIQISKIEFCINEKKKKTTQIINILLNIVFLA